MDDWPTETPAHGLPNFPGISPVFLVLTSPNPVRSLEQKMPPFGEAYVCAPCSHRDPFGFVFLLFPYLAGGARDAHWTGTNEDASVVSVKSIRDAGLTYLLGRKPT